jgi:dTDP-4-dehydrorhamnose 3,5-epimerase
MKFHQGTVDDARLVELEKRGDERGFFARLFCEHEFGAEGLETRFVQANNSLSGAAGTLRGLHYQLGASAEVKLVRCIKGALFDAIVDLRPDSPTFRKWFGAALTAENRLMMYVPRGFAHAILTLEPDTEALYLVSAFYDPAAERGVRWNDPAFAIDWPIEPVEISAKDANWPLFDPDFHQVEQLRGLK